MTQTQKINKQTLKNKTTARKNTQIKIENTEKPTANITFLLW